MAAALLSLAGGACLFAGHIALPAVRVRIPTSVREAAVTFTGEAHGSRLAPASLWAEGLHALALSLAEGGESERAWQRAPQLTAQLAALVEGCFTLEDLAEAVESNALEAGMGGYDRSADGSGGWRMARVAHDPGLALHLPPELLASRRGPGGGGAAASKLSWSEVRAALADGRTVIFNALGPHEPALSQLCLGASVALGCACNVSNRQRSAVACTRARPGSRDRSRSPRLSRNGARQVNVYVTASDVELSAPPHTDKQDVLVLQTQGVKHWRVFAPPEPSIAPLTSPFARGKGGDRLPLTELRSASDEDEGNGQGVGVRTADGPTPLVEVTLTAGQALYIPAGFPHTTSTVVSAGDGGGGGGEASLHLTLNLHDLDAGVTWAAGRRLALARAGLEDRLPELPMLNLLKGERFFALHRMLPLGFLAPTATLGKTEDGTGAEEAPDVHAVIAAGLACWLEELEPGVLAGGDNAAPAAPVATGTGLASGDADGGSALGVSAPRSRSLAAELPGCASALVAHHEALVGVHIRMYLDGSLEPASHASSGGARPFSAYRVNRYIEELEEILARLATWATGGGDGE